MRKMTPLDALLPRTRQGVLGVLLLQAERRWFASELARRIGVPPSSLHRELRDLAEAEILIREQEGKQVYYRANPECPFLVDLQGLLAKTAGLADVLRACLQPLDDRIQVAFVYGSVARSEELATSAVDVLVIGRAGLRELAPSLQEASLRLGRAVSPSVWTARAFAAKALEQHPFVRRVLAEPKLFLKGDSRELARLAQGEVRKDPVYGAPGRRPADRKRWTGARSRAERSTAR